MHTVRKSISFRADRLRPLAFSLLALAATQLALGQAAAPAPEQSKDAKPAPVSTSEPAKKDEVVVLETFKVASGFSGSLAAAAQAKENNQAIVEIVMSEDIGKLPDVSIADSLTRLTGVAAQRVNGRAQNISIRGLTGDFATTMLNGREQVSTGDGRSVEFDQYPAELLNEVIVYKTAGADLTTQGIAGSVDLITVQPLSKTGRQISVNAYYKTTQLSLQTPGVKKDGNSYSIAYIDQLDDGKVGIALGYAHTLTPFEGQQFQAWGYNGYGPGGDQLLTGTKSYVRSSNLTRDGFMGVLEFKPNDQIHSTVDVYYSKFKENQVLRGMEIPLYPGWSPTTLQAGYTTGNGEILTGTFTNVHPVVRNDSFVRDDNLFSIGWNLKLNEKSSWPLVLDAGYSKVDRKDKNLELWSGFDRATVGDTVSFTMHPGGTPMFKPTYNYTDTSKLFLTDAAGWNGPSPTGADRPGYYKGFYTKDELGQFKAFTKHELNNFFKDVEIGAAYTERFKKAGQNPSGFEEFSGNQKMAAYPTTIGNTDMSFLGLGGIAAYDPFKVVDGTLSFEPNQGTDFVAQRYSVTEKIARPYVKFDIDSKMGDIPVTGNVGVQLNSVDQSSSGKSANGSTLTAVSDGAKYNDIAPSLNLNFKVADQTYIKFSVARQIARPRMFDMRAARSWGYNPANATQTDLQFSPWSGDGGNPHLKPWKADSIDLSFDKYFKDSAGYISVAVFEKKLLNYIYEAHAIQDFTGYPVVTGPAPVLHQGTTTTPVNGSGGSVKGVEVTVSLSSELLTNKAIKGFGVIVGGAYTDSSVQPWGPGNGTSPINGLSRKVANITLYYELGGFSARVSDHYRSDYRAYVTNFGVPQPKGDINPGGGFATTQAEKQVDAQISYALQSGPAKGLTFYLQAYNLNNSPLVTFNNGDPRQVMNYQKYGASYSAGVSYKF